MSKAFNAEQLKEVKVTDEMLTLKYEDKKVYMTDCTVEEDVVKQVFKHNGAFIKDATEFAANTATDKFKEDDKLQKIEIEIPYGPTGAGTVSVFATREKTFRVPGSDKTITRPDITTKVKDQTLKAGKKHIESLQDAMLEALKK
jgi:hypothetical protein